MEGVVQLAREKKIDRRDQPVFVDATTDVDVVVVVVDAVSEGSLIAKDRSGVGCDTEALVFKRSRSSRATADIEVVSRGKSVVVEKPSESNITGMLVNPVPNVRTGDAARSRTSLHPSPSVEDAVLVVLRAHIQKQQAENENSLARRAGEQKIQMDTPLKLCAEKKPSGAPDTHVKRLTQISADVRAALEMDVTEKQEGRRSC